MARTERRLEVDDGAVLAALAHPLPGGAAVPAQRARVAHGQPVRRGAGETPANCSYHLRQLAKAGLVARRSPNGRGRGGRSTPA